EVLAPLLEEPVELAGLPVGGDQGGHLVIADVEFTEQVAIYHRFVGFNARPCGGCEPGRGREAAGMGGVCGRAVWRVDVGDGRGRLPRVVRATSSLTSPGSSARSGFRPAVLVSGKEGLGNQTPAPVHKGRT